MNERIKELIEQCTTIEYGVDNGSDRVAFDKEKFAELIIKKCRDIVSDTRDQAIEDDWNIDESMSTAMFDIEEYFGVEE